MAHKQCPGRCLLLCLKNLWRLCYDRFSTGTWFPITISWVSLAVVLGLALPLVFGVPMSRTPSAIRNVPIHVGAVQSPDPREILSLSGPQTEPASAPATRKAQAPPTSQARPGARPAAPPPNVSSPTTTQKRLTRADGAPDSQGSPQSVSCFSWLFDFHTRVPYAFLLPVSICFALRCYLLRRYASRQVVQRLWTDLAASPSQKEFVQHLLDDITSTNAADDAQILALQGTWGSGKSYVLSLLEQGLRSRKPPALFVRTDIWRYSSEQDLQLALLESLLSAREMPRLWVFWKLPLSLAVLLSFRGLCRLFGRHPVEVLGVRLALRLPAMPWQNTLEAIVHSFQQAGIRIVWCLDEIDRTCPRMAQAAISTMKRSLNLPGITVVLPYVREQLRFKVFNLFQAASPDVSSTMTAVTRDYASRLHNGPGLLASNGWTPQWWNVNWVPTSLASRSDTSEPHTSTLGDLEDTEAAILEFLEPGHTMRRNMDWLMAKFFDQLAPPQKERLHFLFEEKYVGDLRYDMPSLTPDDVSYMFEKVPAICHLLSSYCRRFCPDTNAPSRICTLIPKAITQYERTNHTFIDRVTPTFRHLQAAFTSSLQALGGPENTDPVVYFVAWVTLIYHRTKEMLLAK